MKRLFSTISCLLAIWALFPATVSGQHRDLPRMKTVAREALATLQPAVASERGELKELRTMAHCSVMGYGDGTDGFAVVSADGNRLLGLSAARSSQGANPAFEWWLQAANEALARRGSEATTDIKRPNPKRFPISVAPMLTTHWGQMDPYNRLCPYDSARQERTVVGCVATSLAQVLNYYRQPERGVGQRTVYYPYKDSINGQAVTVDFAEADYRWDIAGQVANYRTQPFTDEQAEAISRVMLHMGVAANMQYGLNGEGGSGTTTVAASEGLRNYLCEFDAQCVFRDNFSDTDWMNTVFDELSTGHPLIYGGQAFTGGHSFVLNGYDRNGMVYVNWGWNGDDEGYYDISLLNPGGTSFAERQDMIIRIQPTDYAPLNVPIDLDEAGTLAEKLTHVGLTPRCAMTVTGPMNEADFVALRQALIDGRVGLLSLESAQFDELPERALYGCSELTELRLPPTIRHIGDGALGDMRYLTSLSLTPADDADFIIDGDIIYNTDKSEIICVLPTAEGELVVEPTVTAIHPYAFSGCVLLKHIELPATITQLGAETFRDCYWLESLKVRSRQVVTLSGYDIFDGIDKSVCTLYVPSGLKATYQRRAQWKDFLTIEEFGTTIKANNAVRKQGQPNPDFGYTTSGASVAGTPRLYTDATQESPAGVYTIYVEAGTITAPDVEYVNGRLIVEADTEGIDDVDCPQPDVQHSYDLQGRRQSTAAGRGISIVRTTDGRVVKTIK